MLKRKVLVLTLIMALLITLPLSPKDFLNADSNNPTTPTILTQSDIIILDNNVTEITQALSKRADSDLTIKEFKKYYKIIKKDSTDLNAQSTFAASLSFLKNNEKLAKELKKYYKNGNQVYIYGNNLDITYLCELFEIKDNNLNDPDNKCNIIGLKADVVNYYGIINIEDEKTEIPSDILIQTIMEEKYRNDDSISDKISKSLSEKTPPLALSGEDFPIVSSQYNVNQYLYKPNAWGTQILRAVVNTDWILHKRDTDSDPNYDYFYIEDNAEATAYEDNAAFLDGIHIEHSLPNSTYDNILTWGPSTTSNSSSYSFSLSAPFSVSFSFTPCSGTEIDNTTSGSQQTDKAIWDVYYQYWTGLIYPLPSTTRFLPATGWASMQSRTYASSKIVNTAIIKYATTNIDLTYSRTVNYDY